MTDRFDEMARGIRMRWLAEADHENHDEVFEGLIATALREASGAGRAAGIEEAATKLRMLETLKNEGKYIDEAASIRTLIGAADELLAGSAEILRLRGEIERLNDAVNFNKDAASGFSRLHSEATQERDRLRAQVEVLREGLQTQGDHRGDPCPVCEALARAAKLEGGGG